MEQSSDGVTVMVIAWGLLVVSAKVAWLAEGNVVVQGFLVDLGLIIVSQRLSTLLQVFPVLVHLVGD